MTTSATEENEHVKIATWQAAQLPKLVDGTNFSTWKFRLKLILEERGLDSALLEKSEKNVDTKARSIIAQCVSDKFIEIIKKCPSAANMITKLEEVFERKSVFNQLYLRKKLLAMKCSVSEKLQDHFLKFDNIMADLESTGATLKDTDKVCHLLLTLPSDYDTVITTLETIDRELNIDFVKSRLLDAELKIKGKESTEADAQSFLTCYKCGKRGHKFFQCKSMQPVRDNQRGRFTTRGRGQSRGDNYSSRGRGASSYRTPWQSGRSVLTQEEENQLMFTAFNASVTVDKPPTILFRYSNGPIAQTNDGKLLVYPGTNLHMECLWMRRFGNPKWNFTLNEPDPELKYAEGWTTDPGRDSQLEYRLSILEAKKEDSGVYRCETPARQSHQIEIIVEDVHCPPLPIRRGLVPSAVGTKLGTEIRFSCANGNALLGSHMLTCKASGNWSAPLPVCESVECGDVVLDTPLGEGERPPRVSIVSRGVGGRAAFSCAPGWALRGAPETVCLPHAQWAKPFPVCKEVSCPALAPPTAGYVLGRAPFRAGDVLQFHCNPEHTLHGRPILVCQDSGRWSDKPPTCAQACTYPGTTISGRMSSVKFYYKIGETVTFTCEPGYKLKGAPMLRCLKNRKWSNAIPLCTPISNYTSADSIAMLTSDIDAMLSDAAILPDVLKTRETPAILSPESYKVAVTRAAVSRLLRRGPIENYKNRIFRYNRVFRRDGER